MNITENKRDQSLDIMKGIGILLVVFAHVFHHNGIIYQFHMPLFFILSGAAMTYSSKGYSFQKKVKTLLIPYFVFSVIWFCYWAFLESKFRPITGGEIFGNLSNGNMKIQQFINIFTAINSKSAFVYNIVLWFLPCLFMAEFIFAKVVGGKKELLADIITVIACYLFVQNSDGLPWCFGEALVAVPLLSLGFHIYPPLIKFLSKNIVRTIVIGIACIMLLVILYARLEPHTDMAHNIISNEFYLMAIIGSLVVVTLSLLINLKSIRGGYCIAYLGKSSLIIMCVHEPLKRIILMLISKVLSMPTDVIRNDIRMSMLATVFIVVSCIPIVEIINKRFSWIIGKF